MHLLIMENRHLNEANGKLQQWLREMKQIVATLQKALEKQSPPVPQRLPRLQKNPQGSDFFFQQEKQVL